MSRFKETFPNLLNLNDKTVIIVKKGISAQGRDEVMFYGILLFISPLFGILRRVFMIVLIFEASQIGIHFIGSKIKC